MFTMGVDLGSTASKCLILKNGCETVGSAVIPSGTGTSGPGRAVAAALEAAGIDRSGISCIVATGYGRNSFEGADFVLSELSAHAIGAHAVFPEARTLIDIGGQDAKAIRISAEGRLENFIMNDKCAAGTGRFLDVMARVLELDVSELDGRDALAAEAVRISSTCTVFAESEVISQLAKNVDINSLVRGIHESVAVRTASLVRRLGLTEPVAMSGGVAKNGGVVRALERELGVGIAVSPAAQLCGAYGAAIHGWNKIK
ncbi:MAG: 2-hydroxyglutaryl-CoA dehydratase [Oscillospiraceae bacterium]|nr:2-hydroxyglutaryl-CoA dehydratase [Oscillospiraceae bacterium]